MCISIILVIRAVNIYWCLVFDIFRNIFVFFFSSLVSVIGVSVVFSLLSTITFFQITFLNPSNACFQHTFIAWSSSWLISYYYYVFASLFRQRWNDSSHSEQFSFGSKFIDSVGRWIFSFFMAFSLQCDDDKQNGTSLNLKNVNDHVEKLLLPLNVDAVKQMLRTTNPHTHTMAKNDEMCGKPGTWYERSVAGEWIFWKW